MSEFTTGVNRVTGQLPPEPVPGTAPPIPTRNLVMGTILGLIQQMTFSSAINGATTWRTVSNKLRLWGDVSPDQQPAAFLVTHRETDEYRGLGLLRRRLELGVWCYTRSDSAIGSEDLDTIMEAFESTFNIVDNPSTGCNTLGNLVYWLRIEGKVFKDPGDIDSQTLLIVPMIVEMP
jgi:hypothetical protein